MHGGDQIHKGVLVAQVGRCGAFCTIREMCFHKPSKVIGIHQNGRVAVVSMNGWGALRLFEANELINLERGEPGGSSGDDTKAI